MFDFFYNNRINKLNWRFFIAMTALSAIFIFINCGERYDISVLSIFFLISIMSLYGTLLSIDTKGFSLNKSFCLFFYFFFSLAPVVQFKNKTVFYLNGHLSKEIYLKTGLILLSILLFYLIFYKIVYNYLNRNNKMEPWLKFGLNLDIKKNIILSYSLVIFSSIIVLYLMKWDLSLLIYRPFTYDLKNNTNLGLIGYALLLIFRVVPFIILLNYKIRQKGNDRNSNFFLLIICVICFPTSLPRVLVGVIYIPILMLFFPLLRRGINYVLLFMVGIIFVLPLFNNFRYLKDSVFAFNYELFNSGHFDAFQNMALLINENIITNGRQLMGSLFFFVQESQWLNKPNGSGHLLGETVGYSYLNVSMPFFAEGFVNWGYVGILLFLILIVLINSIWDFKIKQEVNVSSLSPFYLIFMVFEFYLMRGDLYSSVKIFSSFVLAILIVYLTFIMNSKRANKLK